MATETKSCVRELTVEVPLEAVERETDRVTKEFARVAKLPGFRPGKAPAELVRRRFWDDIKSEVLRNLIPTAVENACREKNLSPVDNPAIADLEFEPARPLRFKASFEVLPELELREYKGLEVEPARVELTEDDLEKELEALRERAATFEPVEGRPAEKGDTVVARLVGVVTEPKENREPIVLEEAFVELGGDTTVEAFSEGLKGVRAGEERTFSVPYPSDYPQADLAGRTVAFTAKVNRVQRKQLAALDDAFAQRVGDAKTLEELKAKLRAHLEEARAFREKELTRQRLLEELLARHDFPVPEALVERSLDARLERQVRALVAQGIDPRRVDVDWRKARRAGREGAVREARLALLLGRIAAAEKIEVSAEEVDRELTRMAAEGGPSPEALRARLTKEGRLGSIKSAIRSEKVIEFLLTHARLSAPGREKKSR
jgi:trigger factor